MKGSWTGTQDRILEEGTEMETMEECCLLVCSPWFVLPVFVYNLQLPTQGGTIHSDLGPPISVIDQENPI